MMMMKKIINKSGRSFFGAAVSSEQCLCFYISIVIYRCLLPSNLKKSFDVEPCVQD